MNPSNDIPTSTKTLPIDAPHYSARAAGRERRETPATKLPLSYSWYS
jgi:hypothetical protein